MLPTIRDLRLSPEEGGAGLTRVRRVAHDESEEEEEEEEEEEGGRGGGEFGRNAESSVEDETSACPHLHLPARYQRRRKRDYSTLGVST